MLSTRCRDLCYILLEIRWVPEKWNPAFSPLVDFNKKDEASSGERWSWRTVLLSSVVLHIMWLRPTGILQPPQLCPMEAPKEKKTVLRHSFLQMPSCLDFPSYLPPQLFLSSMADQKRGPVHIETAAHAAVLSSTHFRMCHRTLSCKSHSDQGFIVCAITLFEITGVFPWSGASCRGTGRK